VAEARQLVIVGAGELTESSYLPAAAMLGWRTILVDRDVERAERLARRYRRVVGDVRPSIEGAALPPQAGTVIATPAATHAKLALSAIDAGSGQILLEKPPTTSLGEFEELAAAAERAGASIKMSFLRRGWRSIKTARERFESWTGRFGPLRRASLIDGNPWGWKARATREQGAEGLAEILLDELSHGFDILFCIGGWGVPQSLSTTVDTCTVWEFNGSATGAFAGRELTLDVRVSRTHVLANAVVLDFEGATVTVEYSAAGGVCVRPHGGSRELLDGPATLDSPAEGFAKLLRGAFASSDQVTPPLSEWEGPVALISAFRRARPQGAAGDQA
jgi:predicted dehydrogenase